MPATIPTFPLSALAAYEASPAGVFMLEPESAAPQVPIFQPYRSSYYKVGLGLRGSAELKVNLETYRLLPGSLLVMPAHCIKQWLHMSADFESLGVFFTADFLFPATSGLPQEFTFFDPAARHVLPLPPAQAARLQASFEQLRQCYHEVHLYRTELLQSRLRVLLYELAAAYAQQPGPVSAGQPRAQLIAAGFKRLVQAHCATERRVSFYAGQLCITPKHLTETIREATGRRATDWIAEAVALEARVRLQNPALTVAQVADELGFADQSAFGRYFRHATGQPPTAYRQQL